jgi:hypothetical protein
LHFRQLPCPLREVLVDAGLVVGNRTLYGAGYLRPRIISSTVYSEWLVSNKVIKREQRYDAPLAQISEEAQFDSRCKPDYQFK